MGVSLYTSRIVLNVLGVEDYGIYNVVGGVVAMFAMLNGSMAAASQRFITFELGRKEVFRLKEVFSTTVTIHNLIAVTVLILAETVGLWFLNSQMNISENRMFAANWVYQCSVLAFVVDVVSIPYNASIIAHEHMKAFAYVGVVEVLLKLLAVILLPLLVSDKLEFYAILILLVAIIIRIIYGIYCRFHFEECRYRFSFNKELFKEIASFAGWNFIGASSAVLMTQGVNVLLNLFFGVVVNAAQGIAVQVQNAIGGFINNFMTALNPQITKSYAIGDHEGMLNLVQRGARFSFYLMFFLSLPILIETNTVLHLWLKVVPGYAVIFVQLALIYAIIQTLSNTLVTTMLATGNIKKYQIVVGGLQMLNLPFSYLALKMGLSPQITYVIAIVISFGCLAARLLLLRNMIGLSIMTYIKSVFINVVVVVLFSVILPIVVYYSLPTGYLRLFCVSITSLISVGFVIFYLGFTSKEQMFAKMKFVEYYNKLRK